MVAFAVVAVFALGLLGGCAQAAPAPASPSPPPSPSTTPATSPSPATEASALAGPSPAPSPSTGRQPGEPDPALTPGATNPAVTPATIGATICVAGWTATVRPPSSYTTALKREQIAEYGYADTNLADYEEDHLIPLELGGAPADPRNLWPEPYSVSSPDGTADGARIKDELENALHDLVCAGRLPLATAQQAIAGDWYRAWLTYVGGSGALQPPIAPTPTPVAATPSPSAGAPSPSATGPATVAGQTTLAVRIASLTSPISPGSHATLVAATSAGAACSIAVVYKSGPSSAAGLDPVTADAQGRVSWTWTVGSRTSAGTWPVTVTCALGDATGSASGGLVVR